MSEEQFFPLPPGITEASTLEEVVRHYVHRWYLNCAAHGYGESGIAKWLASPEHTALMARMAILAAP